MANRSCGIYRFSVDVEVGVGEGAGTATRTDAVATADPATHVAADVGVTARTAADAADILPAAGDFLRVRRFRRSARSARRVA